jgi:hypothetical protein
MRLGSLLFFEPYSSPEEWVKMVTARGYRAVSTPIDHTACDDKIRSIVRQVREA